MSNIDPKILSKIKKCLALSSSPNPNEAAIDMRQAHALISGFPATARAEEAESAKERHERSELKRLKENSPEENATKREVHHG